MNTPHPVNVRAEAAVRDRGFTLIEVLVALVVVSLGMLGVIQAVSQTASNSARLRDKTIAHWIAMNQLTTTRLAAQAPKVAKTSDEVEMAGRRWRWTMDVQQTPVETVRRIDITVRPQEADEKTSLVSLTGFYGTALAQAGTLAVDWQGIAGAPGSGGSDDGDDSKDAQPPKNPAPIPQPEPGGEPTDPPPEPAPESTN